MSRGQLTGTTLTLISSLNNLSTALSTSLFSGFRNRFILDLFRSNALVILVLFFQMIWIVEFTRPNSRHIPALFLIHFLFVVSL